MSKLVSISLQNTTAEPTAAQQAAFGTADKILAQAQTADTTAVATPTETLAEQVPQAQAEAVQALEITEPSRQRLTEAAERGEILTTAQEEGVLQPGVFAQATPEQAQQEYLGQLESERTRTPEQTFDVEQGVVTLPLADFTNDNTVAKLTSDIAKVESAFVGNEATVLSGVPEVQPAISALKKLGLTQDISGKGRAKGSQAAAPMAGAVAYLAFLTGLQTIQNDQADPAKKLTGQEQPKTGGPAPATNRFTFVERIADAFEKLSTQPRNVNPETGEASSLGFQSRLSKPERLALGNLVTQSMIQTGMVKEGDIDDGEAAYVQERSSGTEAGRQYEYKITQAGYNLLQKMAPTLEQLVPSLKRPVSQSPLPDGGFLGESATAQRAVTRTPMPELGEPSATMLSAMDVMGKMPNMISEHKAGMVQMMLDDIKAREDAIKTYARQLVDWETRRTALPPREQWSETDKQAYQRLAADYVAARDSVAADMESPFAKLFGQDQKTMIKMAEKSEASARKTRDIMWDGEQWLKIPKKTKDNPDPKPLPVSQSEQERLSQKYPEPTIGIIRNVEVRSATRPPESFGEKGKYHRRFAEEVVDNEWQKAVKTLKDAQTQMQKGVFYHGVTAIGNSSRLMVTSTELNYQANKLARFLTDNPRPSVLTKGGAKDASFRYLAARAILDGADKLTPDALRDKFNSDLVQGQINPIAKAIYEATQANDTAKLAQAITEARALKEVIADEWEGNGEWGFPLDGLHEWGKYLAAPQGSQVATRLKAEVDGINNGSSIQGLQFGDEGIMKRAGILYDPSNFDPVKEKEAYELAKKGYVIPAGNMRGYIFDIIIEPDQEAGYRGLDGLDKKHLNALGGLEGAKAVLERIRDADLIKDMVKVPLMTTIYGKPYNKHQDHASAFVVKKKAELGITDDQLKATQALVANAITKGLQVGLNTAVIHQQVIKATAGWMFNVMNEIPQIRGANGFIIQAGGYDVLGDSNAADLTSLTLHRLDEDGRRLPGRGSKVQAKSSIFVSKKRPSATAPKVEKGRVGKLGSITRNQLAVNGTHNLDATIAQLTLIRARKQLGPTFWGQQVFDAFIGDLDSLEPLLSIANKTFAQVNNTYNMLDAELDAYNESVGRFTARAKAAQEAGEKWDIGVDGEFRGMYEFAKTWLGNDTAWGGADKAAKAELEFSKYGIELDEEGKLEIRDPNLTPMQVLALSKYIEANFHGPLQMNVRDSFSRAISDTKARKAKFRKTLLKQRAGIRQYN